MKRFQLFKLFALLVVLITSINQAWADTDRVVYCAISDATKGSYTLKVNINIGDNNTWRQYDMSLVSAKTFNGKKVYTATVSEKYGGVDAMQFQLYDGETWKAQKQPISSYSAYGNWAGKICEYEVGENGTIYTYTADTYYLLGNTTWISSGWIVDNNSKMTDNGDYTWSKTVTSVGDNATWHIMKVYGSYKGDGNIWRGAGDYDATTHPNITETQGTGTANFEFKPAMSTASVTVTYNALTGKFGVTCQTPVITFDKEDGSSGSDNQSTYYGETASNISTPSKTGHDFKGYWTGDNGTGTKVIDENGAWIQNITNYTSDESPCKWQITSNGTLHAKWTPSVYNVDYKDQGDVTYSGSNYASLPKAYTYGTGIATLTSGTKTGYNFGGWFDEKTCSGSAITTISTTATGDKVFYAIWTANEYTLTFNKNGEAWSDAAAATSKTKKIVYDQAYSTSYLSQGAIPSMALKNGYRFDGWFTASSSGTQLIEADGTWKTDVDGILDGSSHWVKANNQDLYAQYSAGTITDIDFYLQSDWITEVSSVSGEAHMGAVADFGVTPDGEGGTNYIISWQLQYNDGTPLASQPEFTYDGLSNAYKKVKFDAPSSSGTYKLVASLRTGSDRSAGTVVNTATFTFIVASQHTVTVQYKDGSNNTLRSSGSVTVPAAGTEDVTAPDNIVGFSFHHWVIGDGVTCTSGTVGDAETQGTADITISAIYDGSVTAVYNKKNMIYFYNTVEWEDVWVYFYTSDKYWANDWGTGAWKGQYFIDSRPYYDMHRGHMSKIEGTNIWYFDYTAQGWDGWANVAFTNMGDQSGEGTNADDPAPDNDHAYFSNTTENPIQVIRRGEHKTTLPMFVPLTGQTKQKKNNDKAEYLSDGYWMNYPDNTGYTLKIYSASGDASPVRTLRFPASADNKMPLKLDVEFNDAGTHDYWYTISREDGTVLSANYSMNQNWHSDVRLNDASKKIKITTTAPGIYTYILVYTDNNGTKDYYISVDYPIGTGDYRLCYSDNATWSKSAHVSWCHPSDVIRKNTDAEVTQYDTVSFFVSKGEGITTSMKLQYASAIAEAGTVTWTDGWDGSHTTSSDYTIDLSDFSSVLTVAGVYNFIIKQVGTAKPVIEKVEPYIGNYYIRTDCAGNTKWDSYKSVDHQMTFSDYAAAYKGFTHYYVHWVEGSKNVKFTIANDYSPCITDTLEGDTYTNDSETLPAGANIRFMWDSTVNKISRAYISGSSAITDRFLVLEGDAKMYNENGDALTGGNRDHDSSEPINYLNEYEVILHDDQNFVYERTIKVNTGARARLTAKYNNKVQYFIGNDDGETWADKAEELLGGTAGGQHTMRIVYDFKTDRLVKAYVPSDVIEDEIAIHADLMIVRNHQEAGQQLTFSDEEAALTDVKTVYGVMQFNRWTLNNRDGADDPSKDHCDSDGDIAYYHAPLDPADQKSTYERGLYWISFPFDVNLSDVFGFGTYGEDWIIMFYDGEERAKQGYWADSEGFWTYVWPSQRASFTLEKGKGYVLALDLDRMLYNNESCWANDISQVELFFPSTANVSTILATNVDVNVPAHTCEIGPRPGMKDDRTKKDSHWNIIGVPSYANYGTTLLDVAEDESTSTITWQTTASSNDIPYLYEWQMYDNSYIVRSGTTYSFQSMHSYMVQYHGTMRWTLASATPASVAARLTETPDMEYMLSLIQDSIEEDRTYVRMTDKEGVTIGFEFKDDLCKEYNSGRANIWTVTADTVQVAGNSQPHPLTTTVVPVGVKIAANGEYTFSMPEGTNGGDVWLIDNANSSRTNLGLMDYTVNLTTGTYEGRFSLEFPVQNVVTEIENAANANANANADVRKVFVGGRLYILRDGKAYDTTGAQVR